MKIYEKPELEEVLFQPEDVITDDFGFGNASVEDW